MGKGKILSYVKELYRSLSLRTQLLLILMFLLVISISSLSIIYSRAEEQLVDRLGENIDDITQAIQISVEELTYRGDSTQRLKGYVDMLNRKGIREISIISERSEVIASSNPKKIGTKEEKISEKKVSRKKGLMITARLGEADKGEAQKLYNVIMPVSIKGQNIGYIHISMVLDDYAIFARRNHFKRVLSTLFAFSIGIIFSLLIAEKYTEPIKRIAQASKRIAEGELVKIRDRHRKDEIGVLIRSYNEMVDKLSERKELEEKLKKTEQLSMIGQLSSGIAHEIRNPLNFLSLSIGHIKERINEEEMSDKADLITLLDNITKEIYKVNELIHNFLLLGKPITLNRDLIPPDLLVKEVLYILKDKLREEVSILTVDAGNGDPIYCDREYMRLCLMNLVLNAVQAIEGRGEVVIEYGTGEDHSYVSVQDSGGGIGADEVERIFEPYYSGKKHGIGLGLTITRRFVEEHGGTISVESEAGRGTTMTIRVPRHEE